MFVLSDWISNGLLGLFKLYRFCGFELTCFRNLQVLADFSMVLSSQFCLKFVSETDLDGCFIGF